MSSRQSDSRRSNHSRARRQQRQQRQQQQQQRHGPDRDDDDEMGEYRQRRRRDIMARLSPDSQWRELHFRQQLRLRMRQGLKARGTMWVDQEGRPVTLAERILRFKVGQLETIGDNSEPVEAEPKLQSLLEQYQQQREQETALTHNMLEQITKVKDELYQDENLQRLVDRARSGSVTISLGDSASHVYAKAIGMTTASEIEGISEGDNTEALRPENDHRVSSSSFKDTSRPKTMEDTGGSLVPILVKRTSVEKEEVETKEEDSASVQASIDVCSVSVETQTETEKKQSGTQTVERTTSTKASSEPRVYHFLDFSTSRSLTFPELASTHSMTFQNGDKIFQATSENGNDVKDQSICRSASAVNDLGIKHDNNDNNPNQYNKHSIIISKAKGNVSDILKPKSMEIQTQCSLANDTQIAPTPLPSSSEGLSSVKDQINCANTMNVSSKSQVTTLPPIQTKTETAQTCEMETSLEQTPLVPSMSKTPPVSHTNIKLPNIERLPAVTRTPTPEIEHTLSDADDDIDTHKAFPLDLMNSTNQHTPNPNKTSSYIQPVAFPDKSSPLYTKQMLFAIDPLNQLPSLHNSPLVSYPTSKSSSVMDNEHPSHRIHTFSRHTVLNSGTDPHLSRDDRVQRLYQQLQSCMTQATSDVTLALTQTLGRADLHVSWGLVSGRSRGDFRRVAASTTIRDRKLHAGLVTKSLDGQDSESTSLPPLRTTNTVSHVADQNDAMSPEALTGSKRLLRERLRMSKPPQPAFLYFRDATLSKFVKPGQGREQLTHYLSPGSKVKGHGSATMDKRKKKIYVRSLHGNSNLNGK